MIKLFIIFLTVMPFAHADNFTPFIKCRKGFFSDSDYFLNCNIVTDAALPTVISVTPTNLLSTGFTAWFTTIPSPSSNHYYLVYTATKYL